MNEFLCKIISSLNSNEVRENLESLGYSYSIAPLKHYNSVLRNEYTLNYNIKIFNASRDQINAISLSIIKNIFNDNYISLLIKNNICMLSYTYNTPSVKGIDYRDILNKFLGRAVYSYSINRDVLKIIIDIPYNSDVSSWKPTLKKKEPNIILEFLNNSINIKKIDFIFSLNGEELDVLSNTFLDLGFILEKPKEEIEVSKKVSVKDVRKSIFKKEKAPQKIDADVLFNKDMKILMTIFEEYRNIYCCGIVEVFDSEDGLYYDSSKILESKNINIENFKEIEAVFNEEVFNLNSNLDKLKELIIKYTNILDDLRYPPF